MSIKEKRAPHFLDSLQRYYQQSCGTDVLPDILRGVQEKAWDHFLELGLPDKSSDAFRYVPLHRLYEQPLSYSTSALPSQEEILSYVYPECRGSYLVFINGVFTPELSDLSHLPKKVVVLPMADATQSYGSFLQSRWMKALKEEGDPFALLNLAVQRHGLFIYVPPNLALPSPIQSIFFSHGGDRFSPARLQLFLASQTQISWVSSVVGSGVHNTLLDVALEEGAVFDHLEIPDLSAGWNFNFLRSTLKQGSRLKHLALTTGPRISRHSLKALLLGENSDALLQGLWRLNDKAQSHTHVYVEHAAPSAHSLQKFKGILSESAQSSFEGKIFVRSEAQKTEAYQLNQNLLLDEGAIAYAKPNLEIFADDVKASHGATMAQIDEEQLFYLKSRGLTPPEAHHLLIQGFMQEMIQQISIPSIKKAVEKHVL